MNSAGPVPGAALPEFVVERVDADRIRMVALLMRDPNPIHFDRAAAAAAGLGDREVNQGISTLAYVYDMLIAWTGSRSAVDRVSCRFRANVFAGDTSRAGGTVTAVRPLAGGVEAECDVWADRGDGVRVIDGRATVRLA